MTKYYSKSKDKFIDIANMPDQYVRNAFVKMCKHEPTEDTTYQPYDNQGRVRDYQVEFTKVAKERDDYKKKANDMEMAKMNINRELLDAKDKLKDTVTREVYNVMWDNCQKLEEEVRLLRGSREMAYDRMSRSGQFTLDSLAKLYGVETNQELERRLSKMSKEEIKQELEKS